MATLAADIGGVLGLWLGFSVFTIFELIYLLMQMCMYTFKKCRGRREKTQQSTGNKPPAREGKSRQLSRQLSRRSAHSAI